MRKLLTILPLFFLLSCSTKRTFKIAKNVNLQKFVTTWYVIAGRFTSFEDGAFNPVERYFWSKDKKVIHVDFSFLKDGFNGEKKTITQKAWVFNKNSNAHWKIQPIWPLKLDYFILAHAEDYSWSAVGVPNQRYLWIMAQNWFMSDEKLDEITIVLKELGYSTRDIIRAPQQW